MTWNFHIIPHLLWWRGQLRQCLSWYVVYDDTALYTISNSENHCMYSGLNTLQFFRHSAELIWSLYASCVSDVMCFTTFLRFKFLIGLIRSPWPVWMFSTSCPDGKLRVDGYLLRDKILFLNLFQPGQQRHVISSSRPQMSFCFASFMLMCVGVCVLLSAAPKSLQDCKVPNTRNPDIYRTVIDPSVPETSHMTSTLGTVSYVACRSCSNVGGCSIWKCLNL